MHYVSTRADKAPMNPQQFSDILLGGLAPDGGLYLPEHYPQVTGAELNAWRTLSYADLAFEILKKFATDIPAADLKALTAKTYTKAVYKNARVGENAADITPLRVLEENVVKGGSTTLILQALSNGPTLAFKDMAMQLLGNLFEYTLAKTGAELNIFGATSGDTGSAAEYAMRGKQGIRVFMLSPHKKMSAFQTAQMFSLQDPNIYNIAVEGVFDDCQDMVKAVSNDLPFKAKQKIGTVNSINWARLLAQVVYYFAGYFQATPATPAGSEPRKVSFCVPSGNFGNVCAGHVARMMGLPIEKLVVATNENDVLDEFFRTGIYRVRASVDTHETSSPSMDISKASNFERFVFDLLGRDGAETKRLFSDELKAKGYFALDEHASFADASGKYGFASGRSSHEDRLETIRDTWKHHATMIDPHTADGVKVGRPLKQAGVPMIVLETALPVKFASTIVEALHQEPDRPPQFDGIEALPKRVTILPADVAAVQQYIVQHCA